VYVASRSAGCGFLENTLGKVLEKAHLLLDNSIQRVQKHAPAHLARQLHILEEFSTR
jgi:hypothetical protein